MLEILYGGVAACGNDNAAENTTLKIVCCTLPSLFLFIQTLASHTHAYAHKYNYNDGILPGQNEGPFLFS